jgi:putative polyhydroxyalkanoate system protein
MPNLTVTVPHQLSREEARRRIEEQINELRRQHGGTLSRLEDHWTGDRLDFTVGALGQTVTGHAVVEEHEVHVEVALPWLLAMLAGPVKQRIEQRGRNLLGHH